MVASDFQAVVMAAGKGSRMTELTVDKPKCLLPIGNRPMIWFPLKMLEKAGFIEVFVVVVESVRSEVQAALENTDLKIEIEWICVPTGEDWGTADSLRHIGEKIMKDVLVVSCDLITNVGIQEALDTFRKHQASVACLFFPVPVELPSVSPGQRSKQKPERDLVGVDNQTSRLLLLASASDFEDIVTLPRSLLKKYGSFTVYNKMVDSHVYIIKKWVMNFLAVERSFSTLKGELLPYIIKKQLVRPEEPIEIDPNSSMIGVAIKKDIEQFSAEDSLTNEIHSMSLYSDHSGNMDPVYHGDTIRCYCVFADRNSFGIRTNTLAAYCYANQQISTLWPFVTWNSSLNAVHSSSSILSTQIGSECCVGSKSKIAEKTSLSFSCIGSCCVVETKTRIANCIIMNDVKIREGCMITNSIICDGVEIGSNTELKNCIVGHNHLVPSGAKYNNEVLAEENRVMEI